MFFPPLPQTHPGRPCAPCQLSSLRTKKQEVFEKRGLLARILFTSHILWLAKLHVYYSFGFKLRYCATDYLPCPWKFEALGVKRANLGTLCVTSKDHGKHRCLPFAANVKLTQESIQDQKTYVFFPRIFAPTISSQRRSRATTPKSTKPNQFDPTWYSLRTKLS